MIATRLVTRLALTAGLAASYGAGAHSELPSAEWCAGSIRYSGDFVVTRDQLVAELNRREAERQHCLATQRPTDGSGGSVISGGDLTCGISDPPYDLARSVANGICSGASPDGAIRDKGTTVAFIVEPASYNAPDHHGVFDLENGLHGYCGTCVAPVRDTPAPSPGNGN